MSKNFDTLELRDPAEREVEQFAKLRETLAHAKALAPGLAAQLGDVDIAALGDRATLAALPLRRKADLPASQAADPVFAGLTTRPHSQMRNVFMSPGPIFEPGSDGWDWWRLGRFLQAAGLRAGDMVQNCFAYHFTPAGMMFESGAAAIGATVLPAGTGQTDQQVAAAAALGCTVYAGTPDFLKVILDRADEQDTKLAFDRAMVSGGALFPSLREAYEARGITTRQCYATAELGLIAYESSSTDGMILDEGVIVEIVRPGTGDPVPEGEVGEVVVSVLNPDYPLLRFATGDLSAVLPGTSPCGRTNTRIKGWMGRADQTTKVKGMFVRPEQIATLATRVAGLTRLRLEVRREGEQDAMVLKAEASDLDTAALEAEMQSLLKLRGRVEQVAPGSLPNDGKVIDDQRSYE